ncbi:MAG: hypothetical protein JXB34_06205 [Bacteroidales bacterium]|nr:hypothetical protein [Bacteroidales bacterium]
MGAIEEQLIDSSRVIADIVVTNIGKSQELFDQALALMLADKYPLSMRAARVVQLSAEKYPEMLRPHIQTLINTLLKSKIDGVKRCTLKVLLETKVFIDEEQLGELADICFRFASEPGEAIAIRAFSIDILFKVVKKYPEIKPELKAILESVTIDASAGLKNKCTKLLKVL